MYNWAMRLAFADYAASGKTLYGLRKAVHLAPGNAQYYAWLAEFQESQGLSPDDTLRTASTLNPLDSSLWIRLGLRAEIAGDYAQTERCLIEAARVDRQFDPRWALMNYYFRRGDRDRFWLWAQKALEMSYGDLVPIFRLCWRVTQDAEIIRRIIPPTGPLLSKYLSFLLAENQLEAAAPVALQLAGQARPDNLGLLLSACDRFISRSQAAPALATWDALLLRKLLPYPTGAVLTNGDFSRPLLNQAFDWRTSPDIEISTIRTASPARLKLSLTGRQPESCDLLWQYVPLSPGRRYRFHFEYQVSGAAPESGLRWRLSAPAANKILLQSTYLSGDEWSQQEVDFSAGDADLVSTCGSSLIALGQDPLLTRAAQQRLSSHDHQGVENANLCKQVLGRLVLGYERTTGTTRLEGSLALRNLRIELAP